LNKTTFILFFLILFSQYSCFAQVNIDTLAIKKELGLIFERDQKTRTTRDSVEFMKFIDSTNLVRIEALLNIYGWLGRSFVGEQGNSTVFLVVQHSDLATQEKYFPMLKKSVEMGESRPSNMALMQDRILMRKGQKQIYGSQVVSGKEGKQEFYPIEDEKNVNVRRAQMGMTSLEEYAKHFGIDYVLPKE